MGGASVSWLQAVNREKKAEVTSSRNCCAAETYKYSDSSPHAFFCIQKLRQL